jgi:hypothetical protein
VELHKLGIYATGTALRHQGWIVFRQYLKTKMSKPVLVLVHT